MFGPHFSEYQTPIPAQYSMMRYIHADVAETIIIVPIRNGVMVATFTDGVKTGDHQTSNDHTSGRMHTSHYGSKRDAFDASWPILNNMAVQTYLEAINLVWSRRLRRL
jgi:hypothetical protein